MDSFVHLSVCVCVFAARKLSDCGNGKINDRRQIYTFSISFLFLMTNPNDGVIKIEKLN